VPCESRGWLHGLEGKAWPRSPRDGQLETPGAVMPAWWAGAMRDGAVGASDKAVERRARVRDVGSRAVWLGG